MQLKGGTFGQAAPGKLKPFWMQFKKDEAKSKIRTEKAAFRDKNDGFLPHSSSLCASALKLTECFNNAS